MRYCDSRRQSIICALQQFVWSRNLIRIQIGGTLLHCCNGLRASIYSKIKQKLSTSQNFYFIGRECVRRVCPIHLYVSQVIFSYFASFFYFLFNGLDFRAATSIKMTHVAFTGEADKKSSCCNNVSDKVSRGFTLQGWKRDESDIISIYYPLLREHVQAARRINPRGSKTHWPP